NPPRAPGSGTPPVGSKPPEVVVRDHRGLPPGFERLPSGQVVRSSAPAGASTADGPIVRDHRGESTTSAPPAAGPIVRDHRGESASGAPPADGPVVRDHRSDASGGNVPASGGVVVVRDHRIPEGGVTVTQTPRGDSAAVRELKGLEGE